MKSHWEHKFYIYINNLCLKCAGADLLKMSKEDFVQICGPADGIRLFNAIKGRFVTVLFVDIASVVASSSL